MDSWGYRMVNGCYTVSEMAAIGMGLERNTFTKMLDGGRHKLAPTGNDMEKNKVGTIFAGHHYDFNFITIHGKSRYPGLFAWLRTGEKFPVKVPQGHLLLQAGKLFEWLTGGYVTCGLHEVVYTEEAERMKKKAVQEGKVPWRISSTMFAHLRPDLILKPMGVFATPERNKLYPEISVEDHHKSETDVVYPKK